ncbi:MAG: SufE family protein [Verrucomicrobiota bacterium]|nr:SufE family protein [Verrucomicrobiota bacterium]
MVRVERIKQKFSSLPQPDDRYSYLIDLGRALPLYPPALRTPSHIVPGCQSTLYLAARLENGLLHFSADADALISKGLAALLLSVYSGLSPEEILNNPPTFLHEIGLFASLSPNRSNGLAHIYHRIRQEAVHQSRK